MTRLMPNGLPYPKFFEPFLDHPEAAGLLWMTREQEVAAEARAYRKAHGIPPAVKDPSRLGGSAICVRVDMQTGFCAPPGDANIPGLWFKNTGGSLYVPNAEKTVFRTARWGVENLNLIGQWVDSLDTHRVWQIFHPDFWRDQDGNPAPPLTVLVEVAGVIRPLGLNGQPDMNRHYTSIFGQKKALGYIRALAAQGSTPLTIWPIHCRLGSTHHPLMPILSEVSLFHEIARYSEANVEIKGYRQFSECYGICGEEVSQIDGEMVGDAVRMEFIDLLLRHKVVVIVGEAAPPFCVGKTVDQLRYWFEKRSPDLVKRLYIMKDCMDPIPAVPGTENDPDSPLNFPAVAEKTFKRWASEGINVVESTDNFLEQALAA